AHGAAAGRADLRAVDEVVHGGEVRVGGRGAEADRAGDEGARDRRADGCGRGRVVDDLVAEVNRADVVRLVVDHDRDVVPAVDDAVRVPGDGVGSRRVGADRRAVGLELDRGDRRAAERRLR